MTWTLASITARQLLGRRRGLLLVLLALVPVAIALLYRFAGDAADDVPPVEFASGLIEGVVVALVLPLTALVFGTAALGAEIEDGTAVYLLATPVQRWRIVLVKVAMAAAATIALVTPATLLTALIVLGTEDTHALAVGFALAVTVGAVAYCAVFVALSAFTGRALIVGLGYVFVWETFATNIFSGTRWASIREYTLGVADFISSAPSSAFAADLDGGSALVAATVVIVVAYALGVRFLSRFEIGERA
jgi:ABC-2 type transport system permease protein